MFRSLTPARAPLAAVLFALTAALSPDAAAGSAAASSAPAAFSQAEVTSVIRPSDGGSGAVSIGEPVIWTVQVTGEGRPGASLTDEVAFGIEWAVVEGPRTIINGELDPGARPDLHLEWTLLPLEPGACSTPSATLTAGAGDPLPIPTATIEVLPSLGESEDAPRPLPSFREVEGGALGNPGRALVALGTLLFLPILLWGLLRLRRRGAPKPGAVADEPSALDQIAALDPDGDPGGAMTALVPIVRRSVDGAAGARRSHLTDSEWAEALRGDQSVLAAVVEECSLVRFGAHDPTIFAARDAVQRAESALGILGHPTPGDRTPGAGT